MPMEELTRKRIKKLKKIHPEFDEEQLERELIPVSGDEIGIKTLKKKKRL